MTTDSQNPLDAVTAEAVVAGDVEDAAVRETIASSNPLERQRGVEVCETLAEDDVEHVRPFLDDVAPLANDSNAAIALRAISVLDAVATADPDALAGRLDELVAAAASDIVDVQLTAATALGKLVVARPDAVAPHVDTLVAALRDTEPSPDTADLSEYVDDSVTRQTIEEHERGERRRRVSARRTLVNVVVAVAEETPEAAFDAVDGLTTLLDDVDPGVAGGAVDALGQLAAADPGVVAPVADQLVACLDHDRKVVRARAVAALGHLGDADAVPDLRDVAADDPDEDVRELAAETADYLADAAAE